MKKLPLLYILSFIFYTGTSFAYTGNDVGYASLLAESDIIKKQDDPNKYRLDDEILRQEVIGMALKMKGISLPSDYKCRGYYSDATQNDWVCRALEIAADNGIITRSNITARPKDKITPEEATAMFMNVKKVTYPKNIKASREMAYYSRMSQWMIDLHEGIRPLGIQMPVDATRKNIFSTTYQIQSYVSGLRFESCSENPESRPYLHILGKRLDLGNILHVEDNVCLGLGYGDILYKTGEILSIKLSGDGGFGGIISINAHTGTVEQGGIEWVSQDGAWGVLMTIIPGNINENSSVFLGIINMGNSTRDGNLQIYDSYNLPIYPYLFNYVEVSPDYNMIAIYSDRVIESKIYVFNRTLNKIIKEVSFGDDEFGVLASIDNNGKYTLTYE